VREFFFALNENATTTRDNDPLTPLFLFFLLRESSRIFLLTQPHKDSKTNFLGRKQKRPLQRKTQKIQKNKNFVVTREIFPAPSSSSSSSSSSSNVAAAGAKRQEEKEREIYRLCFVSSIRSRATNTHQRQRALTIQRQQINNNKT
jgi:hypothetical protein